MPDDAPLQIQPHGLDLSLEAGESIVAAQALTSGDAKRIAVVVTSAGRVFEQRLEATAQEQSAPAVQLADVSEKLDLDADIDVHARGRYCAVVNRRGTRGVVIDRSTKTTTQALKRGDYHVGHCTWPIAFFERASVPHLVHGTDWNRLDITRLDTGEILTSASQPEDGADSLDYFHSRLHLAPDASYVISNGWVWSPFDCLYQFRIQDLLTRVDDCSRPLTSPVSTSGYNWDRPLCFLDSSTIAWAYNSFEAGDESTDDEPKPSQLYVQKVETLEVVETIDCDYFALTDHREVQGDVIYDPRLDVFAVFADRLDHPLRVLDRSGELLLEVDWTPQVYSEDARCFLRYHEQRLEFANLSAQAEK